MEIFDSNNSSSSDIMWESWETGVELRNSHVMWIAGDYIWNQQSAGRGPGAGGRGPGAGGLYSYSSLSGEGRLCSKRGYFFKASSIVPVYSWSIWKSREILEGLIFGILQYVFAGAPGICSLSVLVSWKLFFVSSRSSDNGPFVL